MAYTSITEEENFPFPKHFFIYFQCILVITFCYFPVLSTLTSSVCKIKNTCKRNNAWQCPMLATLRSCLWEDASTEASHEREARETTSRYRISALSAFPKPNYDTGKTPIPVVDPFPCAIASLLQYPDHRYVAGRLIKQGTHVRATSWALPIFHQLLLQRAKAAKRSTSFQPLHLCTWTIHHP